MIRSVLAVATVTAIAIGMSAAKAQEDPIKAEPRLTKTTKSIPGDQIVLVQQAFPHIIDMRIYR